MFRKKENEIIELLAIVSNIYENATQEQLFILIDSIENPKERLIALKFLLKKNYYYRLSHNQSLHSDTRSGLAKTLADTEQN